jgi:hypothetical protein
MRRNGATGEGMLAADGSALASSAPCRIGSAVTRRRDGVEDAASTSGRPDAAGAWLAAAGCRSCGSDCTAEFAPLVEAAAWPAPGTEGAGEAAADTVGTATGADSADPAGVEAAGADSADPAGVRAAGAAGGRAGSPIDPGRCAAAPTGPAGVGVPWAAAVATGVGAGAGRRRTAARNREPTGAGRLLAKAEREVAVAGWTCAILETGAAPVAGTDGPLPPPDDCPAGGSADPEEAPAAAADGDDGSVARGGVSRDRSCCISIGPAAVTAAGRATRTTSAFMLAAMPPGVHVCSFGTRRTARGRPRGGNSTTAIGGGEPGWAARVGVHQRGGAIGAPPVGATAIAAGPPRARRTAGGRDIPAAKRCTDDAMLAGRGGPNRPSGGPGRRMRCTTPRPRRFASSALSSLLVDRTSASVGPLIRRCSESLP